MIHQRKNLRTPENQVRNVFGFYNFTPCFSLEKYQLAGGGIGYGLQFTHPVKPTYIQMEPAPERYSKDDKTIRWI